MNSDWGLGDIVTATFTGVWADCKVEEVSIHAAEGSPVYETRAKFRVLSIVPETVDPVLLLGTYHVGDVWRSRDDGVSWDYRDTLVNNANGAVNAFCSAENGWIVAGTGYGAVGGRIWISKDRGMAWALVERLGTETLVSCITRAGDGGLLAGTYSSGQIYRSRDNGESWVLAWDFAAGADEVVSITLAENDNLVATVNRGINAAQLWLSTDDGESWTLQQTVDANHNIECNTLLLSNGWLLTSAWDLFAVNAPDTWRSVDNGVSWVKIGTTGSEQTVWAMVQAHNGNVVAVGDESTATRAIIWLSTDNGITWTEFKVPDAPQDYWYASHAVVAENGDILVALDADHWPLPPHLWRSQDNGVTWAYLLELSGYYYIDALALLE